MSRVYYNKLIRDNVPGIIRARGTECEVRAIDDPQEYQQELLKKVREEALPLSRSKNREQFFENLADLLVVIDALKAAFNVRESDVEAAVKANRERKGGFEKKFFLHWTEDDGYQSDESVQGISPK